MAPTPLTRRTAARIVDHIRLVPGFVLDRPALEQVRAQQQALVDGRIADIGKAELFDLNRTFHETVIACSRNTSFVDALHRIDNLRRLIEYRRSLARELSRVPPMPHSLGKQGSG